MALPPRASIDHSWPDEIAAAARTQMWATAKFYKGSELMLTTPARVQHLRSPLDASSAVQMNTRRAIRLQVPMTEINVLKGWIVQISDGVDERTGAAIPLRDPTLAKITMTVQSAINSSSAAVRTIEAISELAPTQRVTP